MRLDRALRSRAPPLRQVLPKLEAILERGLRGASLPPVRRAGEHEHEETPLR